MQPLQSSLNSSAAGKDEEDEEDVRIEREENPISPFTCRRNSSGRNPAKRIQSLQSSLKSAVAEYSMQFHEMEADLVIAKRYREALTETNKKLREKLRKAKEQSCKKFQGMEAELGKAELVNRDLDKRNKKLVEKFHKARGQYWKKFLDIKTELNTAKSQNKELVKRNNKLEAQHYKDKEQVHELNSENFILFQRNYHLEEELNRAKERENSRKRNLEQKRNKLQELCTTFFAAVTELCDEVCKQQKQHLSKKRKHVPNVYEVSDWVNCSNCLEPWTEYGEHNACAQYAQIGHHYISQIYDGKEKFEQAD